LWGSLFCNVFPSVVCVEDEAVGSSSQACNSRFSKRSVVDGCMSEAPKRQRRNSFNALNAHQKNHDSHKIDKSTQAKTRGNLFGRNQGRRWGHWVVQMGLRWKTICQWCCRRNVSRVLFLPNSKTTMHSPNFNVQPLRHTMNLRVYHVYASIPIGAGGCQWNVAMPCDSFCHVMWSPCFGGKVTNAGCHWLSCVFALNGFLQSSIPIFLTSDMLNLLVRNKKIWKNIID